MIHKVQIKGCYYEKKNIYTGKIKLIPVAPDDTMRFIEDKGQCMTFMEIKHVGIIRQDACATNCHECAQACLQRMCNKGNNVVQNVWFLAQTNSIIRGYSIHFALHVYVLTLQVLVDIYLHLIIKKQNKSGILMVKQTVKMLQ